MNEERPIGQEIPEDPIYEENRPYDGDPGFAQPPYGAPMQAEDPYSAAAVRTKENRLLFRLGLLEGIALLGYLLMRNIFVLVLRTSPALLELYQASPEGTALLNACYTLLCVGLPFFIIYLVLRRQKFLCSIPLGGVNNGKLTVWLILAGLGLCFVGDVATNYFAMFADSVGLGFTSYYQALEGEEVPQTALGLVIYICQSALLPAMIEEFAFRGVVMQPLRKFGDWFAIWTSALLFGLMHANMTQVPFAIIAGVSLGYVATVSGSLWVSILIHFLNNFFAVAVSILQDRAGESVSLIFSNVALYSGIGIGLVALIVFIVKNPAWARLRPGTYTLAQKKKFFLSPTLLVAAALLFCITLADINVISKYFYWAL